MRIDRVGNRGHEDEEDRQADGQLFSQDHWLLPALAVSESFSRSVKVAPRRHGGGPLVRLAALVDVERPTCAFPGAGRPWLADLTGPDSSIGHDFSAPLLNAARTPAIQRPRAAHHATAIHGALR